MLKFNIRDEIKYKITNKGKLLLEEDLNDDFISDYLSSAKENDGYYKESLFQIMMFFGKNFLDKEKPIEKDVIINDKYTFDIINGMAEVEVTQMGEFWLKRKFGEEVLDNFPITRDRYRLFPFGQLLYYFAIGINPGMQGKDDCLAINMYIDAKELTKEEFSQMYDETNHFADSEELDQAVKSLTNKEQPKKLVKKPKKDNRSQQ